ncbi:MAG: two-component system phosphate regulon sensor histidine kinase PhoR, partial [Myxococcota bacterium]
RITLVGADRRVVLDTDGDSAGTEVASLEGSSDGVFVVPGNDGDQWVARRPATLAGGVVEVRLTGEPTMTRGTIDHIRITAGVIGLLSVALAYWLSGFATRLIMRPAEELAVASLARERDRIETVLENMSEAVLALDTDLEVTLLNSTGRTLLQQDKSVEGDPLVDMVRSPELHALARTGLSEATRDEFELLGERVIAHASPLESGGTVITLTNVTELRGLERIRRDFVANVSHELRTPVAVIRANAETLVDGAWEEPKFARRFIEGIHRNSERLAALLDDLLDLSRIEAGRYELKAHHINILEVAQRIVVSMESKAADRETEIVVAIDAEVYALADDHALEQILTNLIDNGIKYTPANSRVTVRGTATDDQVRIEVEDDGPGISQHDRDRIFERFYRVDKGRSREEGGTGLGLAIVKHLVEAMGGTVSLEPASDQGTTFVVSLPAAVDAGAS